MAEGAVTNAQAVRVSHCNTKILKSVQSENPQFPLPVERDIELAKSCNMNLAPFTHLRPRHYSCIAPPEAALRFGEMRLRSRSRLGDYFDVIRRRGRRIEPFYDWAVRIYHLAAFLCLRPHHFSCIAPPEAALRFGEMRLWSRRSRLGDCFDVTRRRSRRIEPFYDWAVRMYRVLDGR